MIYLASYPRSGNTLLRAICWHCFSLKSGSVYPNDLGGNADLEAYAGHTDDLDPPLRKTHGRPPKTGLDLIYVVRDGRAAGVSLHKFMGRKQPLAAVLAGHHRWGRWDEHVRAWMSRTDKILRYEDMVSDLPGTIEKLAPWLGQEPTGVFPPGRDEIAGKSGGRIQPPSDWRKVLRGRTLERFHEANKLLLKQLGYTRYAQ